MPSLTRTLVDILVLVSLASAVPAPQVTTAPTCVHDACSKKIAQTPHPPMCPAYLAAGPGNTPAPPTFTMFEGCDASQIYSVCSCFFQPTITSSVTSASVTTLPTSLTSTVTTTSSASASTTSLDPESPSPCPYPDHSNVTSSDGNTYEILCGWNVLYNDDPSTYAETMEDCIDACDAFVPNPPGESYDQPCVAVTFTSLFPTGVNCYLHYSTEYQEAATGPYYDSAILVANATECSA